MDPHAKKILTWNGFGLLVSGALSSWLLGPPYSMTPFLFGLAFIYVSYPNLLLGIVCPPIGLAMLLSARRRQMWERMIKEERSRPEPSLPMLKKELTPRGRFFRNALVLGAIAEVIFGHTFILPSVLVLMVLCHWIWQNLWRVTDDPTTQWWIAEDISNITRAKPGWYWRPRNLVRVTKDIQSAFVFHWVRFIPDEGHWDRIEEWIEERFHVQFPNWPVGQDSVIAYLQWHSAIYPSPGRAISTQEIIGLACRAPQASTSTEGHPYTRTTFGHSFTVRREQVKA